MIEFLVPIIVIALFMAVILIPARFKFKVETGHDLDSWLDLPITARSLWDRNIEL